jgi:hypothetical protein
MGCVLDGRSIVHDDTAMCRGPGAVIVIRVERRQQ